MSAQPKILLASGIGDIYWVMVKMESFLKEHGLGKPLIYTWEGANPGKERSSGYIKRIPFVEYGGTHDEGVDDVFYIGYRDSEWKAENYKQYDFFICPNGVLREGHSLESHGMEKYETNWHFDLKPLNEPISYESLGRYVIAYLSEESLYKDYWLKPLTEDGIYRALRTISERLKCKVVLVGKHWDNGISTRMATIDTMYSWQNDCEECIVNMTNTTDIDHFFALIEQSLGMWGFPSGATIKSVYFKKPTYMIWSKHGFNSPGFYTHLVAPEAYKSYYDFGVVEEDDMETFVDGFINLVNENTQKTA